MRTNALVVVLVFVVVLLFLSVLGMSTVSTGSMVQPTTFSEFVHCRRRDRSRGRRGGGRGGGGGDWRDDLEEFIRKTLGEQNSGSGASELREPG